MMEYRKSRIKPKEIPFAALGNLILMAYTVTCIYPIFWLVYSSFKTRSEFDINVLSLPKSLYLENLTYVFTQSDMFVNIFNSMRNSVLSVFVVLLFAFINGYFIARFHFKGRNALYTYYMIGMLIPVHALLIPIYIVMSRAGMTDAWYSVPLPLICFNLPTTLFLCESYIRMIPKEIDEAASIDGAGLTRTLFTIILPMTAPILVTGAILAFFNCWNEFAFSLVLLNDKALHTVPLGLTLLQGTYSSHYPRMMAAMLIAIFPALLLYFIFSKQIINGMMAGAVKG